MVDERKTFASHASGFWLTFPDGTCLSTQFGPQNYCDNRSMSVEGLFTKPYTLFQGLDCNTCEVAIWDKDGVMITQGIWREVFGENLGDMVEGWVDLAKWVEVVNHLSLTCVPEIKVVL